MHILEMLMNSRFAWRIACRLLVVAIPLGTTILTTAPAAAASAQRRSGQQMDSAEAEALSTTEAKLAALAREAAPAPAVAIRVASIAPGSAAARKLAAMQEPAVVVTLQPNGNTKKRLRTAGKGKTAKKRSTKSSAAVKADHPEKKVQNVVDRRLTRAEVLKILSTTRDFTGTDLSGMNLVGIDFSGVKFNRANLNKSNMARADLAESDLELADLRGADLRGASLIQARLRGTQMQGVHVLGALWVDRSVCKQDAMESCLE